MQSIVNAAKARLDKGEIAIGMGIRGVRGVEIARLMKSAGYDWLFIDLEHGATSTETAFQISVAALDAGIAPFVRVPHGEFAMGARCLDAGALGIVIPHVDTVEVARAMVEAFKFRPLGHRSIGGAYPQFGFAPRPADEVMSGLNAATMLVAMVETPQAVENADGIAGVPGIDALLVGTNDLCIEMGIPGKIDDPRVAEAMDRVIAACKKHGKYAALGGVYSRDLMKQYLSRGFRMVLAGNDISLLLQAAQDQSQFVRSVRA